MDNPPSSPSLYPSQPTQVIRFGFDKSLSGFNSDFYSESLTNGRASSIEIKNVLSELGTVQRSIYLKMNIVFFVSHACILLTIILFALNIYSTSTDLLIFHFLAFLSLCFTFWSILRCMDLLTSKLDKQRTSQRKAIADRYNIDFSAQELKWHTPIHSPGLVELWKHYETASNPQDGGSISDNNATILAPIIFYLDECSQKFDSGFYSAILTGGRVSQGELNDALADIEIYRKPIALKARLMNIGRLVCCISMGSFWPILFWYGNDCSEFYLTLFTGIFLALGGAAWGFLERKRQLEDKWKHQCRVIAGRYSKKLALKGLRWDISTDSVLYIVLQKARIVGSESPRRREPLSPSKVL